MNSEYCQKSTDNSLVKNMHRSFTDERALILFIYAFILKYLKMTPKI